MFPRNKRFFGNTMGFDAIAEQRLTSDLDLENSVEMKSEAMISEEVNTLRKYSGDKT